MDRARIVDAALTLLAAGGLGALSMRRLADDLGVRVNTIYWHVPSKQALVAELGARIAGDAPGDADAFALLTDLRRRMLAVRDGGEVVAVARALGPEPLPVVAALTAHLTPALGERARLAAEAAVTFAVGAVVEEQSRAELERVDEAARARPDLDRAALFDLGATALLGGLTGTSPGSGASNPTTSPPPTEEPAGP